MVRWQVSKLDLQPLVRLWQAEVGVSLRWLQVAAELPQPATQPQAPPPRRVGAARTEHTCQGEGCGLDLGWVKVGVEA